jgi:hypothetical protein
MLSKEPSAPGKGHQLSYAGESTDEPTTTSNARDGALTPSGENRVITASKPGAGPDLSWSSTVAQGIDEVGCTAVVLMGD